MPVRSEGSIPVASMIDSKDCDGSSRVIDAMEHAVRSPPSTMDSGEFIAETTSNPMRTALALVGRCLPTSYHRVHRYQARYRIVVHLLMVGNRLMRESEHS